MEKGYNWKKDEKGLQVAINPQDRTIQDLISQLHFELAESKFANHKKHMPLLGLNMART